MNAFLLLLFVTIISTFAVKVSGIRKGYIMPEKCRGQTYCTEKDDQYPDDDDFETILKNEGVLSKEYVNRIGHRNAGGENISCRGNYSNATIYYIVDKNNVTLPVVQFESYFMQTYELRYCNKVNYLNLYNNCEDRNLKRLKVEPLCETQHMYFDFVVVNSAGNLQLSQALIPVCCKCTYK